MADLGADAKTHAHRGGAEELRNNRANHRQRRVDLERIEDERQGRRKPQFEQRLIIIGRIGLHEIPFHRARAGKARGGVHEHREERHDDDHGRLRLPVEAKPHHHDRRDADDRQRRHEIAARQQAALKERRAVDQHGDDEARAAADGVAREHAADRLHPVGGERRHGDRQPPTDRGGRGQDDRRHAERLDAELPDREHDQTEQQRRREIGGARIHDGNASLRSVRRPISVMIATSAPESAAAVNSAAQICTVWP